MNEGHYAPQTLLKPGIMQEIDYTAFKKSPEERAQHALAKMKNKEARRQAYGENYKRFLNIPSRTVEGKAINSF